MPSYQSRLERKKKIKEFTQGFALLTSIQWKWIKSKLTPDKLFHRYIIDDINKQLESGVKEVRYYIYSGVDMYESLEDNYKFYQQEYPNGDNTNYCEDYYVIIKQHIEEYFSKFDDIEFSTCEKELCGYFSIKTKF